MPPRKKQSGAQHAAHPAPDHADATGSSLSPAACPSLLLALPAGVLEVHVWQYLSPWGRGQLRATCRALRDAVDAILQRVITLSISPAASKLLAFGPSTMHTRSQARHAARADPSKHGHGQETKKEVRDWHATCALLARCPHTTTLALRLGAPLPDAAVEQLRIAAAATSITRLSLSVDFTAFTFKHLAAILCIIPRLCPSLTHLQLHIEALEEADAGHPHLEALKQAMHSLPASLQSLHITTGMVASESGRLQLLLEAVGAATQLTQLTSLDWLYLYALFSFRIMSPDTPDFVMDVAPLVPLASHLTHLQIHGGGHNAMAGFKELVRTCGGSLTSVAVPVSVPSALGAATASHLRLAEITALCPNLQRLTILMDVSTMRAPQQDAGQLRADLHALSQLTSLTSLAIQSRRVVQVLADPQHQPPNLSTLRELTFWDCGDVGKLLLRLLSTGVLSPDCQLLIQGFYVNACLDANDVQTLARRPSLQAQLCRSLYSTHQARQAITACADEQGDAAAQRLAICRLEIAADPAQRSVREAVRVVISRVQGLEVQGLLSVVLRDEVASVAEGKTAAEFGLWLLPELVHIRTLVLAWNDRSFYGWSFLRRLGSALACGFLPHLQHVQLPGMPVESVDAYLVPVLALMRDWPRLQISLSRPAPYTWTTGARATLARIPVSSLHAAANPTGLAAGQLTIDEEGRRLLCEKFLS